ncbi:MAG TPA: heparinase II/III family protein [Stellaceae bacterium]|nr:heparinase II/III family protein [Stellaceae bacterium]
MVTEPFERRRDPVRQAPADDRPGLLTRLRRDALQALKGGRLYRHTLSGPVPPDLRLKIGPRWPGDAQRGAAIAAGEIGFAGELIRNPAPRWFPPGAGEGWLAAWHGFDWLGDLVLAGAAGRDQARTLVQSWIADNSRLRGIAWRSDVLATRISAWVAHFDEIAGRGADPALRRAVLESLVAQLRHLWRTATWEQNGAARIRALKGLLIGMAALAGSASGSPRDRRSRGAGARLGKIARLLAREIPAQILEDGGHRSRSPSQQLQVLQDLIDARAVLRAAGGEVPGAVQEAIERMAPILRLFRHGDRRLALFNGSFEENEVLIDLVLARSETAALPPAHAAESGFHRLQAGNTLLIVDAGKPPPRGFDAEAHAGVLSFEMSHGSERIVVNCGAYRGARSRLSRASAAHSVLVVADTNAVEIRGDGTLGRAPHTVACERAEHEGQQWIAASHDGYRTRFGLTYSRQLFVAADGEDVRGEETLTGRPGAKFTVRFHLHPALAVALAEEESVAVIRLPSGMRWHLRAAGAAMSLGESVYLGSGRPLPAQQVMLSGTVESGGSTVRWALRRAPRRPGEE